MIKKIHTHSLTLTKLSTCGGKGQIGNESDSAFVGYTTPLIRVDYDTGDQTECLGGGYLGQIFEDSFGCMVDKFGNEYNQINSMYPILVVPGSTNIEDMPLVK